MLPKFKDLKRARMVSLTPSLLVLELIRIATGEFAQAAKTLDGNTKGHEVDLRIADIQSLRVLPTFVVS